MALVSAIQMQITISEAVVEPVLDVKQELRWRPVEIGSSGKG
jgi:hypothetical protein